MKLMTWNVNGIRALQTPIKQVLDASSCDVICFQETKVAKDQLESDICLVDGYSSYFSCSRARSGYSGVATYCSDKMTPIRAQEGLFHFYEMQTGDTNIGCYGKLHSMFTEDHMLELDKEGRTVITQHQYMSKDGDSKLLTIINVYCPRADPDRPERKEFKLDFYRALEERASAILNSGSSVIVCGDVNTSHRRIDHCDPADPEFFYDNPCREWMDQLLYNKGDYSKLKITTSVTEQETPCVISGGCFVDSFRYYFPDRRDAFTCWCTLKGCRQTNYGTRIDYILVDYLLHLDYSIKCDIFPDVEGSDHCPVRAELSCAVVPARKCPQFCTKYMAEFGGRQQKLSQFFATKATGKTHSLPITSNIKTKSTFMAVKRKADASNNGKVSANKQTKLSHFVVKPSPTISNDHTKLVSSVKPRQPDVQKKSEASQFWKALLKGPGPPPLCKGHDEPCVMRTVKKEGPNCGRRFYCCARPEGHKTNADARCPFFQWKE